jgi:hypothetical protein
MSNLLGNWPRSRLEKEQPMLELKKRVFVASVVAVISLAPVAPAAAAGVVPWIVGRHVVGAVLGLATLPFAVASAALSADQQAPYPTTPDYTGSSPGYYAAPNYYARLQPYYRPAPPYYAGQQPYYRPAFSYGRALPRFYGAARGYYAPRARYTASYGAHFPYRSGSSAYRRR